MPPETLERDLNPRQEDPGSGTDIAMARYTHEHVQTLLVSRHSPSSGLGRDVSDKKQSQGETEHLSTADREALFSGLRATLQRPETCEGASAQWGAIEQALLQNPRMMRNLKKLQDMGAELVVMEFQEGQYVEFADAAQNLDIRKQEAGLAGLTEQERNDAIETIVSPIGDDTQRAPARAWLLSRLRRSGDARGLNFAEALVYAAARGGTLISHAVYDAMAKRETSVYEYKTWAWYFKSLSDVISSGFAPRGRRFGGRAPRYEGGRGCVADRRDGDQGGRVAGLRVEIAEIQKKLVISTREETQSLIEEGAPNSAVDSQVGEQEEFGLFNNSAITFAIQVAQKEYGDRFEGKSFPSDPSVEQVIQAFSREEQKKEVAGRTEPTLRLMVVEDGGTLRYRPIILDGPQEMPLETYEDRDVYDMTCEERVLASRELNENPDYRKELDHEDMTVYNLLSHGAAMQGEPIDGATWSMLTAKFKKGDRFVWCAVWCGVPSNRDSDLADRVRQSDRLRFAVWGDVIS